MVQYTGAFIREYEGTYEGMTTIVYGIVYRLRNNTFRFMPDRYYTYDEAWDEAHKYCAAATIIDDTPAGRK